MNFDMNLLVVLHVLLEERSVTRAGERLGRTQSAVSNALKRLRDHFGDPLLVRSPGGLSPTPRAAELAPMLATIVAQAESCVRPPEEFDPGTAVAQFSIGAPDRFSLPVFLPLLEYLGKAAPNIVINQRTTDRDYAIRLIERDEIDLAIGWFDSTPPHVERSFAVADQFVVLCRQDHPLLAGGKQPDLDDILRYSHLVVSSTGDRRAAFDATLERHGLKRSIAATVMSFTIVPELLIQSNHVGVFTHRTGSYFATHYPLEMVPVPLEVAPVANHLIWHRRYSSDQAHQWLRQTISRACAGDFPLPPLPGHRGRAVTT